MKKIKTELNINEFPVELRYIFDGVTIYDSSSHSNAKVYYIDSGYYIKIDEKNALKDEANLSRCFYKLNLGVEVVEYISTDKDYLVTKSAIGEDLTHYLDDPVKLCKLLANALRNLHSKPIDGIPVSSRYTRFIEAANGDINGGYYDEFVILDRYKINSKEEAWQIMQENKHLIKKDTLIHGDPCLPNVIQKNGVFSSFIDFNMSGVGDKHIDIYWVIWSLNYNLKTDKYTDLFLDLYGRDNFSESMLYVIAAYEAFG